jgi:hypothetical protein
LTAKPHYVSSTFLEFPRERTDFSDANYAAVGRALAYATSFEAACRALSSLQHIRERIGTAHLSTQDADAAFAAAVAGVWNLRLRQHIKRILEHREFPSDVAGTLKRAREARNEIAHEITPGISHTVETEAGRSNILSTLTQLVRRIADGYIIVELVSLNETHETLLTPEFISTYPSRIVQWITRL